MAHCAHNKLRSERNHRDAKYWAVSTDDGAQAVLDALASLEAQLTGLTLDTSRMN